MADRGLFRNANGVYCIRYELPRTPDGKRRQRFETLPGLNKKQADDYRSKKVLEIRGGGYIPESTMTLAEYLSEWLIHQQSRLKPTTFDSYRKYVNKRIVPRLGHHRLATLTPYALEQFYGYLQKDGLAPKTVANIHGIIRSALSSACRQLVIKQNPAALAQPPSVRRSEIHTAADEEIVRLLEQLDSSKYRVPALIGLATGMRRGEVLALRWEDFHAKQGVLMVRRSLSQTPGKVEVTDTKTGNSRAVLLPEFLVGELLAVQASQPEGCGWICADSSGFPPSPQAFSSAFRRIIKKAGISITVHGLRHTHATVLLEEGIATKAIQERLGHSRPDITERIYMHVRAPLQVQAAEATERRLGGLVRRVRCNNGVIEAEESANLSVK